MKTSRTCKAICTFLSATVVLSLGAPLAAKAQDPVRRELIGENVDELPLEEIVEEVLDDVDLPLEHNPLPDEIEAVDVPDVVPEDAEPAALPSGETKTAVTPSRISLPNAEGSIEGMGESFAPVLSSGTATFSVPIAIPAGRAGVQPSVGLSYASTNGNSCVGFGWNMSMPFIVRQSDRGLPRYIDGESWTPLEDQFFYNGGQELIPVDNAVIAAVDSSGGLYPNAGEIPAEVVGWQQYRARIEGGFMRFFRDPNGQRWIVQGKDGTRFDFGRLPLSEGPGDLDDIQALQTDPDDSSRIYKWLLTRMSDSHGSTVYYRYSSDAGERYCEDIFYISPATCASTSTDVDAQRACSAPLSDYGARVHFDYEARDDVFSRHISGWRVETRQRLARITVTAAEDKVGQRYGVRRYHLDYDPTSFHSLLSSVQVEGREDVTNGSGLFAYDTFVRTPEEDLGLPIIGTTLPPMTFEYTRQPVGPVLGFGGISSMVRSVANSPNVSVDTARADLFDVNTDGLPDLIVTDPARYRGPDGGPAVGVFFNGFVGPNADPAGDTAVFSDAIGVPMPASLSGVLNLGSLNVLPMDVDGEGRSDLLHLPRRDRYGIFTPTRMSDAAAGDSLSPADQGWRFTYREIEPEGDDPRIDLSRFGEFYRSWDVNGDHLVDIVRTTGDTMQTWLNLGWTPGGDGKFGQATWDGAEWQLSSEPYETCLPHDGLPLDFASSETRTADMNGDGLVDIVKMRRGRIVWWPSRGVAANGVPVYGEGPLGCEPGFAGSRHVEVASPPAEVNPELAGVFLADVNGDGASDVVQVRFRQVDVWFNEAGQSFTERVTVDSTYAPDFAPRLRFADIDGSTTTDLVYGNAGRWEYLDFMDGTRPRLLRVVHNGLGATTTLTYGSSAEDYVEDLVGDEFTWSQVDGECDAMLSEPGATTSVGDQRNGLCVYRSGGSLVVSSVVRAVSTTDNFDEVGREENVLESRFAYHDGYYEGIEQEFRGFGAADAEAVGDVRHPTALTRTFFHQGRRPSEIATDRLADSPGEALKGRQFLSEVFDAGGTFLSTSHATIQVRRLAIGLDGRAVWYAFVSRSDELRYDTMAPTPGTSTLTFPSVAYESVDGAAIPYAADWSMNIPLRANEYAHIQSTTDEVDNLGQVRQQTALGRVFDWEDPRPDYEEEIVSVTRPSLTNGERWIWRTANGFVTGHGTTTQLGRVDNVYDSETGDLLAATQAATLDGVPNYDFSGDAFGAEGFTLAAAYAGTHPELGSAQLLEASTRYDPWGNPVATCGGADLNIAGDTACLRYATVGYDASYTQLPLRETIAVDRDPSGDACDPGGTFCTLTTSAEWDRGFGVLLQATDPNDETSNVGYDGLGRLSAVTPPAIDGDCASRPASILGYDLVPDGQPLNVVRSTQLTGCGNNARFTIQTRSYVDGLGRARASVTRAEGNVPEEPGARRWEQAGVGTFTARGTATDAYNNAWIFADPPTDRAAVSIPSAPNTTAMYDAFGRGIEMMERDGSKSRMAYGALSTVAGDALDVGELGDSAMPDDPMLYFGTFTVSRVDGHGRAIDQALHQRNLGSVDDEFYRLFTRHRADNAVVEVTRAQTATNAATDRLPVLGRSISRTFTYDSIARRLGTTDPDSEDPSGAATSNNWRYLFNRVGDLVAVRDSRGCGQNFYYDWAGRLVAEDYVLCEEAQLPGESPDETLPGDAIALEPTTAGTGQEVDCRYYFDSRAPWASPGAPDDAHLRGRLTGSSDRGQRAQADFDPRGRPIWSARQMALVSNPGAVALTRTGELLSVDEDDHPTATDTRVFDEAHTYVSTSEYDRIDRPVAKTWPRDPDFEDPDLGPVLGPELRGTLAYNFRSLPTRTRLFIDGAPYEIVRNTAYEENRLVTRTNFGTGFGIRQVMQYDDRLRPTRMVSRRNATPGAAAPSLSAVTRISDYNFSWDAADNLLVVDDQTVPTQWPGEQRPRRQRVQHDALYRVVNVASEYRLTRGSFSTDNPATDWRDTQQVQLSADPMRRRPAPMVPGQADQRVADLTYEYDWLANMVEWTDDASSFYERSLGTVDQIVNGFDQGLRPTALYLSTNIRRTADEVDMSIDRGGWVRLRYGRGGNVESMTVRARCVDRAPSACFDDVGASVGARESQLAANCSCASEQHYEYRWDELNRIAEARRYDRAGSGDWAMQVRQRYRYDGSNVRTVKQTIDGFGTAELERVALYVMPGDFERRGLVANQVAMTYEASSPLGTETQYVVSGARVVWKSAPDGTGFERDARITMPMTNLIQSITGVVDLVSGELLEVATFYPNGARETLRSNEDVERFQLEPIGFTGKEGDDEVALTYFGERYLLAHVGRWASVDPQQIHNGGGGEFANSFHYVSGNVLQARDPLGLDWRNEADQRVFVNPDGSTIVARRSPTAERDVRADVARRWQNRGSSDLLRELGTELANAVQQTPLSLALQVAVLALTDPMSLDAARIGASRVADLAATLHQAQHGNSLYDRAYNQGRLIGLVGLLAAQGAFDFGTLGAGRVARTANVVSGAIGEAAERTVPGVTRGMRWLFENEEGSVRFPLTQVDVASVERNDGLTLRSWRHQGRESRVDWRQIAEFDDNLPRHIRGWLRQERRRIDQGLPARTPPGWVMAHGRLTPAREGFDYASSRLSLSWLNQLEERMRRRLLRLRAEEAAEGSD